MPRLIPYLLLFLLASSCSCLAADSPEQAVAGLFRTDKTWSGGDGHYSIALKDKSVWFFGDTFLGTITGGKRIDNEMVHNTIGIQNVKDQKMQFYWNKEANGKAASFFPEREDFWLWPGDGASSDGKLYCFAKQVITKNGDPNDPFGFIWRKDELLVIDNADSNPESWQLRHVTLPFTTSKLHLGTACLIDSGNLYVLGMKEDSKEAILARIPVADLASLNLKSFEFYKADKTGKVSWTKQIKQLSPLWKNAAAEGSISHVPGGFLCVYHRGGMGDEIVGRTAKKMEGPWSDEKLLYKVPQDLNKRGMCYAAKAHPEQSCAADEIILSFSVNPGSMEANAKDPDAYFPHIVCVKLPAVE